jgi:LysM repeat protein
MRKEMNLDLLKAANCIAANTPLQQNALYLPPSPLPTPPPCQVPQNWVLYTIQEGDTLFSLARSRGSTVYEVLQANCRNATEIVAGTGLYLPPGEPQTAVTIAPEPEQVATGTPAGQTVSRPVLESPIQLGCETNTTYQRFSWSHPLPLPEGWNFEVRTFDVQGQYKSLRTREELSLAGLPWMVYLDRTDENWQQPYWEIAIVDENGNTQAVSRYTPFLNCP